MSLDSTRPARSFPRPASGLRSRCNREVLGACSIQGLVSYFREEDGHVLNCPRTPLPLVPFFCSFFYARCSPAAFSLDATHANLDLNDMKS